LRRENNVSQGALRRDGFHDPPPAEAREKRYEGTSHK
jgi:hypothetical protein